MKFKWKQADTCLEYMQILTVFKLFRIFVWKITPFSWFREFLPPFEQIQYHFFAKMGTIMSVRFGQEVCVCVRVCWGGGGGGGGLEMDRYNW